MAYSGNNQITHLLQLFRQSRSRVERTTGAQTPRRGSGGAGERTNVPPPGRRRGGGGAKPTPPGSKEPGTAGQPVREAGDARGQVPGRGGTRPIPAPDTDVEQPRSPRCGAGCGDRNAVQKAPPFPEETHSEIYQFIYFFKCPVLFERGRGTSLPQTRIHIHESAGK